MKKISLLLVSTLLTLTLLLFSCGQKIEPNTIEYGLYTEPDALDPDKGGTMVGRVVMNLIFDKLFEIDEKGNIIPALATSYQWKNANKTLELTLKQGVKFQDGTPFNAEAVVYNINRSLTLDGSRRRGEISAITSVNAVSDYIVDINLKEVYVPLIATFTDRAGMMISPTADKKAKEAGKEFSENPIGSGPLSFVSRVAQDKIVLTKFKGHHRADEVKIEKLVFHMIIDDSVRLSNLKSGSLNVADLYGHEAKEIVSDSKYNLIKRPGLGAYYISLNVGNKPPAGTPFTDIRVRQALELAIDRERLVEMIYDGFGEAYNQLVSSSSKYYNPAYPMTKPDIEKAKQLLKETGLPLPLKVTFSISNSSINTKLAQILQSMLGQVGFELNIVSSEFVTHLNNMKKGDYTFGINGWSGRVDMDGNLAAFYLPNTAFNYTGYSSPEMTQAIEDAQKETDEAKRTVLYQKALGLLVRDKPDIMLYNRSYIWGTSSNVVDLIGLPDGSFRIYGTTVK